MALWASLKGDGRHAAVEVMRLKKQYDCTIDEILDAIRKHHRVFEKIMRKADGMVPLQAFKHRCRTSEENIFKDLTYSNGKDVTLRDSVEAQLKFLSHSGQSLL